MRPRLPAVRGRPPVPAVEHDRSGSGLLIPVPGALIVPTSVPRSDRDFADAMSVASPLPAPDAIAPPGRVRGNFCDLGNVARLTGLEPATPGVTGRYSNQLSYNRAAHKA